MEWVTMQHPQTGGTAKVARSAWEQVWSKHPDGWQLVEEWADVPLLVEQPEPEPEATDQEDE